MKYHILYLVGTIWSLLLLTLAMCFDNRRPMSTKLKYKYRVKDDSIFRKIIKCKDEKYAPCTYFKVIPFYTFLLLSILSLILLLVDIFFAGFISDAFPKEAFIATGLCFYVVSIVYFLVIIVWWEIVDYNEMKFTKEEKEKLKELKKNSGKRK